MLTLSHSNTLRSSFALATLLISGLAFSPASASADDALVDEGVSQIVADEAADRLARYLNAYEISTVRSIIVEGQFRSLKDEALSRQLINSLQSRKIVVDESSATTLNGQILLSQDERSSCVMMQCTLTDKNAGDLCTIRIRKVLTGADGI
ncbi:MAG: hypothetical protein KDA93_05695 [Planctomycetaceae bacterium]|nr:hypothetical protein [Planctomycetaceae bacterium]